jgi:hypothetical protein
MTEIVQNNNSMKFDLLETGNSSLSGPDSNNLFNNLLGNVDRVHVRQAIKKPKEMNNK